MPTPFEILITARKDTRAIPQTTAELKDLQSTAQQTGKTFEETGAKSENYGRMLARGIHVAQSSLDILAPSIGKIAPQFDSAIRAAQQFGGAMSLAFSYGPQGVALAAFTAVIGLAINKIAEARQAVEQVKVPFEELKKTVAGLGPAVDPLAAALQKVLGVTAQVAAEMSYGARANEEYRRSLQAIVAVSEAVAASEARRGQAVARANELQRMGGYSPGQAAGYQQAVDQAHELDVTMLETSRSVRQLAAELPNLQAQARATADAEGVWLAQQTNLAAQTKQMTDEVNKLADATAALQKYTVSTYNARYETDTLITSDHNLQMTLLDVVSSEHLATKASDEHTRALAAERAAAQRLHDALAQMVQAAITPTAVTAEDMAAAQAGKYITKWDEARRRMEAVAQGTPAAQYGPAFEAQLAGLQKLGYTAESAAAAFKDFSLFADPKNLNLIDWGPVVLDVQHQIDMLIGKANVAKEAFDQVWESLSPSKKAQLAGALGVDPTDANNAQKVFEAMSGGEAKESAKTTDEIAKNIQIISGIHTAIVDIQKSTTFDAMLAEILDDLAKIPASADVVVTLTYQTAAEPGAPGAPVGGEVNVPGPAEHAQHGGSWVIPPGFNENYPIYGSSGERVTVLPADMSDSELDYFIKKNFGMLEQLYNANPQYWMGIAASHPGWGKRDWYEFIFGNQWGHFKLSDLGIPPAGAGGKPTTSKPGDSYHAPVYNAPVYYSFTVHPRDYESLMRDARAAAAHGA